MSSLNLDLNYFDHPKVKRLIGLLGGEADVFPLRLWAHAGKFHARDGKLRQHTPAEIESLIGWRGEPGRCVEALIKCRFIHKLSDGYQVHDWLDHAGHLHTFKERAKAAAKARWGRAPPDATSTALAGHGRAGQGRGENGHVTAADRRKADLRMKLAREDRKCQ